DFWTRYILLRYDSLGDLYPVTKQSPLPTAFVTMSYSTWHQRLGHPRDDVLRTLSSRVNMFRSMWLLKHKFHANGTLSRYKARLVANGSSQHHGIDVDETFSPVVKPATICTVLSLAVFRKRPIHQLDVKNVFLNGNLSESYTILVGFYHSRCDTSLFIYQQGSQVAYLLIYVDDIILTASSAALLQQIITSLHQEFDMTDLGALNYFLGISATRSFTGLFLSQKKYSCELLKRANMVNCNPSRTPVDTDSKLGPEGVAVQDPTLYRSLAGGLQYLTFTRPDLSYVVQQICLYMHDPRKPHFAALNVSCGTSGVLWTSVFNFMLPLPPPSLGDNLLSWSSKRQHIISRSSAKAKYHGVANVVAETAWLRNLLRKLHSFLSTATLVYCDNVSVVYLSVKPVQHQRTKHIEIDIHFVRDMVQTGHIQGLHATSRYQYADIFIKGLSIVLFEVFRSSLSVQLPPAQTAGAY
nr:retrotransposon protein, putative, unclassified [Tanacetum cinerariifolium]